MDQENVVVGSIKVEERASWTSPCSIVSNICLGCCSKCMGSH